MSSEDIQALLASIASRLDDVAERVERIEQRLQDQASGEQGELRERLEYEQDARRRLGEQTQWLIDMLGQSRQHIAGLKQKLGEDD